MFDVSLRLSFFSRQDSAHSPVLYPISILLHLLPWQNPKTPKSTPPNEARGICLMIGVEITEMSSKTNAASSSTVRGVAGLNILKSQDSPFRNDCGCQRPQDAASEERLVSLNAQGVFAIIRRNAAMSQAERCIGDSQ
jgi:hypothetical protein